MTLKLPSAIAFKDITPEATSKVTVLLSVWIIYQSATDISPIATGHWSLPPTPELHLPLSL